MFESLSDRLEGAFQVLQGNNKLTDINIAQSVREIRRALVAADVNYKIAKEFTDKVKDEALGTQNVLNAVKPGQLMVKIVQDELTKLMGGQHEGINIKVIATSEIKISVLIDRKYMELAVQSLHDAFELEKV